MSFVVHHTCRESRARTGTLTTTHGDISTPIFMPVGTQATVKSVSPDELDDMGAQIILSNTYHLNVRPGMDVIDAAGGLHAFMNWTKPILTDSGGYQVFSLAKLRKIHDNGVEFRSHIDGTKMFLGPVEAMAIQKTIGSDIAMLFDECPPYPCSREDAAKSWELTYKWAKTCKEQERAPGQQYFAIVQGSNYEDLRVESAQALIDLNFDGYAIGGLSVGEPIDVMYEVLGWVTPILPTEKPRYLMGVGTPPQLLNAIAHGIDMFDCVLPTRVGRNGCAYTPRGMVQVKAGRLKKTFEPIDSDCTCYACRNFTLAYIRHLLNVNETFALRLVSIHNLHFYLELMKQARHHIQNDSFEEFRKEFVTRYEAGPN